MYPNKHKHINYLLFIVVISLFWTCSPKFNYGLKSFLFDGVPDPYKVEVTVIKDSLQIKDSTLTSTTPTTPLVRNEFNLHSPYAKRECNECHNREHMGKPKLPLPNLCYQCHEDFNKTYKVVHGPVASGNCTQCHSPHQSKLKNLLTSTGQDLCMNCHKFDNISIDKNHKEIKGTSCTECHNPHGGDETNLLLTKQFK